MAEAKLNILAKDTVIYGMSSMIGRFLNWLLVPLYTYVLKQQSDYGIVTNLYAWTALLLVILTYGMETGFFRFANKEKCKTNEVYTTALSVLFLTSLLFALTCVFFRQPIASWLHYDNHPDFIMLLGIVVSMDAFASIPFAYLRFKNRALRFAGLKLLFVFLNILFNLFFFVVCPRCQNCAFIHSWYNPSYGVGYVFVANILATTVQTLCLLPDILAERYRFSFALLRKMLAYSLPLLVLGVCGIMNQTLDRIIFPYLSPRILSSNPDILSLDYPMQVQAELGIYGACFKVAMVMMMFTQAFRYAYEPFVFAKQKEKNAYRAYADATKYYTLVSFFIMFAMIVFSDILKFIIAPSYWEGLAIIPLILWAYIFQGVYFNLSFWYKLTDKTYWGAVFSVSGLFINLIIQIGLVRYWGYIASALSSTLTFFILMTASFIIGKHYLKIPYETKKIVMYTGIVLLLLGLYYTADYLLNTNLAMFNMVWHHISLTKLFFGCVLLVIFCYLCYKKDIYVLRYSGNNGSTN